MRPAFILTVIGGGALLIIVAFTAATLSKNSVAEPRGSGSVERLQMDSRSDLVTSNSAHINQVAQSRRSGNIASKQAIASGDDSNAEARDEAHQVYVAERIAELRDLPANTHGVALQTLLLEVSNPDPEIRQASLNIISQTGNRGVIPDLIKAAEQNEDAGVKRAITETIDFLRLPTLTEVMRQKKALPVVGKE